MSPVPSHETLQRAAQVCSHCKSIKKGCDKKLPSCSQCIKRRAICRYGTPEPQRREDVGTLSQVPGASGPLASWNSIPRSELRGLNPNIRLSILLTNSISDTINSTIFGARNPQTTGSVIYSQVRNIITADGDSIESVGITYFSSVHRWMPILSSKRFWDRLQLSSSSPPPDFSVLLLAMRLVTKCPSPDLDTDQDRHILYLATKTLFAQVQSLLPTSLCLAQTGVILARYEQAHGMIEAAYITVGTTARIACAIGIDSAQCSHELWGSDTWFAQEEALSTWWGLVICDRNIACDSRMNGRSLATRQIRDEDYMPLEGQDLSGGPDQSLDPGCRYYVSATFLPDVGPFGREAQSMLLYDKVKHMVESGAIDEKNLIALGRELQMLLGTVIELSTKSSARWNCFSGSKQMLIIGLFMLHQDTAPCFLGLDSVPEHCAETIRVTLHTITRMTIDMAHASNKMADDCSFDALPPTIQHFARSANHHIMTCQDFQDPQWQHDLDELKNIMAFVGRRWTFAGQRLDDINKTAEMAAALYS